MVKIKHIPIKDFLVRFRKKGKKKGRPSKEEIYMSKLLSEIMARNEKEINKTITDAVVFGTGVFKVTK